MAQVARILSFTRSERNGVPVSNVIVDSGGGFNITAEHYASSGDDSYPLTTDYVFTVDGTPNGTEVAVGYLDPINASVALEGDKRIFARDTIDGLVSVALWLKRRQLCLLIGRGPL